MTPQEFLATRLSADKLEKTHKFFGDDTVMIRESSLRQMLADYANAERKEATDLLIEVLSVLADHKEPPRGSCSKCSLEKRIRSLVRPQ